jgi:hypothetical protein
MFPQNFVEIIKTYFVFSKRLLWCIGSVLAKFAGSNPAEAVGFLKGDKNPQHAFLRKGSKIIGPMSQICGM